MCLGAEELGTPCLLQPSCAEVSQKAMIIFVRYVLSLKRYLIYSAKLNVLLFGYYQHHNNLVHRLVELNF